MSDSSNASHMNYISPSDDAISEESSPMRPSPKRKRASSYYDTVVLGWSESLFLAVLFGAIAILLPTFFYFISGGAMKDHKETVTVGLPDDHGTMTTTSGAPHSIPTSIPGTKPTPQTLLSALVPYALVILSSVLRALASSIIILRPFTALLSVLWALLYPGFVVLNLIFRMTILLPWRIVTGTVGYFYPAYVFGVVAVLFSAIVGLVGRVTVQGGRRWLASGASAKKRGHDRSRLRYTDSKGKKLW